MNNAEEEDDVVVWNVVWDECSRCWYCKKNHHRAMQQESCNAKEFRCPMHMFSSHVVLMDEQHGRIMQRLIYLGEMVSDPFYVSWTFSPWRSALLRPVWECQQSNHHCPTNSVKMEITRMVGFEPSVYLRRISCNGHIRV